MNRRNLLLSSAALSSFALGAHAASPTATLTGAAPVLSKPEVLKGAENTAKAQPPLPYSQSALAPVIGSTTVGLHYGKHHKKYFDELAKLLPAATLQNDSLESIVRAAVPGPIANNAGQAWNHNFYWRSIAPKSGGKPPQAVRVALEESFGPVDTFNQAFTKIATEHFGSGWAWLCKNTETGKLVVVGTHDAASPLTTPGLKPLMVVDVWEHAYYKDYSNEREKYVTAVMDKLLNWRFVEANMAT